MYATARKPERMAGLEPLGCTLLALDTTKQASIDAAAKHVRFTLAAWRLRVRLAACCCLLQQPLQSGKARETRTCRLLLLAACRRLTSRPAQAAGARCPQVQYSIHTPASRSDPLFASYPLM